MSNPGIKILAENHQGQKIKRFVIEDNIGESIHLHVDNIRLDFSIRSFLSFSQTIRESLHALNILKGYPLKMFDEHFLSECSSFLLNLRRIEVDEVSLKELQAIKYVGDSTEFKISELISVNETNAFKYLNNETSDFLDYSQFNYYNMDNKIRLKNLLESIKINGYPYLDQYIILFDDANIIRDGQHRASILAYLYGMEYKIKILRFYFTGDAHIYKINQHSYYTELCKKVENLPKARLVLYGYGQLGKALHAKYTERIDYIIDNHKYDDNSILSFNTFCERSYPCVKYCFLVSVLNANALVSIRNELLEKYVDCLVISILDLS